jgi:hypothetical protein
MAGTGHPVSQSSDETSPDQEEGNHYCDALAQRIIESELKEERVSDGMPATMMRT